MRSGIEDFSRPFFAFIWPSRPQWAPPRLLPARGENGKRGSDIKKTLSPPLWIEARGGIWDVDLGACGSRLTPPCSGTAPVRQHGGRTPRIPAEGITRHTRAMAFAVARSRVQRPCFRMNAKTHSLHCSSSPNRTRCAGLRSGLEPPTGTIPILHPY